MSKSDNRVRYHFSTPKDDIQVIDWLSNQHNISISIRLLIKDYIARYGITDASCIPIKSFGETRQETVPAEPAPAAPAPAAAAAPAEPAPASSMIDSLLN